MTALLSQSVKNPPRESLLIYMTFPDMACARRIGMELLASRLVAGLNFLPAHSIYWWDGKIQDNAEVVAIAQSAASCFEAVRALVCRSHPYDVPCVVAIRIDRGHAPFLEWIAGNATAPDGFAP